MRARRFGLCALAASVLFGACGGGPLNLPRPRPLVIQSGERLNPEEERLGEIYRWVQRQMDNIQQDPSFWIVPQATPNEVYPWESLDVNAQADTARIGFQRTNTDVASVYQLYAHFHLMQNRGEAGDWIPEAAGDTGWDFERKVMARVADAWLLGRASFGFAPSRIMDELVYAREDEKLEPLLLTIRGYEFPEAREAWLEANPRAEEELRAWFRETFDRSLDDAE